MRIEPPDFSQVRVVYLTHLTQCSISIPPENVRKPKVSDVFRRYRNGTLG